MQIITTMRGHYTSVKMAKISKYRHHNITGKMRGNGITHTLLVEM